MVCLELSLHAPLLQFLLPNHQSVESSFWSWFFMTFFAFSELSLPKEEYPRDAHFQAGSSRAEVQANVSHFYPPGLHSSPTHNSSLTFINVY